MKTTAIIPVTIALMAIIVSCKSPDHKKCKTSSLTEKTKKEAVDSLTYKYGKAESDRIGKGVEQAAEFWQKTDGTGPEFVSFCMQSFVKSGPSLDSLFNDLCYYFENLKGHYNMLTIELMRKLHEPRGPVSKVDEIMGSYDVTAHFEEDMYANKLAFLIQLNFPFYTLKEKNELGRNWTPRQWGYARMGDMFTTRVPAALMLKASKVAVNADNYISNYNIYMGNLLDAKGKNMFPKDLVLISHWGLRDELKSHYADSNGIEKQEMIYSVMKHIINQTIPQKVINNPNAEWQVGENKVFENKKPVDAVPEANVRYKMLLDNFKAQREFDSYYPQYKNTIERKFDGEMEMSQPEVEQLFVEFVSSKEIRQLGKLIEKRLGRKLHPFDIWYDGFKARSGMNEDDLTLQTQKKFPDNKAFQKALPDFLKNLGFDTDKAAYIAAAIAVDPASGSGHAWGAEMKSDVAHLRTRIPATGMNYKGYNIAVHEFGHNVEQTISLHFVDNYLIKGVPNTAFTEALAFIFQKRDLMLLGMNVQNQDSRKMEALDIAWSLYEIMGVSLVDMKVWQWMYEHPKANEGELKDAVVSIAKDVWNKYYADVFGSKDEPLLAIYSHMIDNPLYLSNYPLGHIIEFQVENYLKDKKFADEVFRMYSQGSLTPQMWMQKAVGAKLSTKPVLSAVADALKTMDK